MNKPWYARYVKDILVDTMDLDLEAFGLYNRLLDLYWIEGGPLPNNPAWLAKQCRLNRNKFERVFQKISHYFEIKHQKVSKKTQEKLDKFSNKTPEKLEKNSEKIEVLCNPRMDFEIAQAVEKSKKSKAAADTRWGNDGDADAMPSQSQSQSHTQSHTQDNQLIKLTELDRSDFSVLADDGGYHILFRGRVYLIDADAIEYFATTHDATDATDAIADLAIYQQDRGGSSKYENLEGAIHAWFRKRADLRAGEPGHPKLTAAGG